jgi:hypothetical protein
VAEVRAADIKVVDKQLHVVGFLDEINVIDSIQVKGKNNKVHNYCAVNNPYKICNVCYKPSGESKGVSCTKGKNLCFGAKCLKCQYYGHFQWNCLQGKAMDGTVLEHSI